MFFFWVKNKVIVNPVNTDYTNQLPLTLSSTPPHHPSQKKPKPKQTIYFHVSKPGILKLSLQKGGIFPEAQAADIGVTLFNHGKSGEWVPPGERKKIAFLSSQIV